MLGKEEKPRLRRRTFAGEQYSDAKDESRDKNVNAFNDAFTKVSLI